MSSEEPIRSAIQLVKDCAVRVYEELGSDWPEKVYQEALEVELRQAAIEYESQRILPVDYKGFIVGEGIPDLVIWVWVNDVRTAIIVDLKQDSAIKESHELQVRKYIEGLRRQLRTGEIVYDRGLVICFPKASLRKINEDSVEWRTDVAFADVDIGR